MTARARRHALSRNDENVNEARGGDGGAKAHIARRSTSRTNKIREGSRRETEGGGGIRGKGIALIVSRRYSFTRGRSRTNFFASL